MTYGYTLSHFSRVWLFCDHMDCSPLGSSVRGILQARILSGLPCPPPGDLPNSGIDPPSLVSPALQESLPAEPLGKPHGVQLGTISGLTPNKLCDLENKRFTIRKFYYSLTFQIETLRQGFSSMNLVLGFGSRQASHYVLLLFSR